MGSIGIRSICLGCDFHSMQDDGREQCVNIINYYDIIVFNWHELVCCL